MNYNWLNEENDTLIYIGDTMCSWCHGIAPELDKLKENHPEIEFKLIMGGLRPYNTQKAIEMADFLKEHWTEIEKRTGQPFAHEILNDPEFVYDTEPASRACVVVRQMKPEIEFEFFKAVQNAFYRDNHNTNNINTYIVVAATFGLDLNEFERLYNSEKIKENTKVDFQITQQMGIKGFPSVVLKRGKEFKLIAHGYQTANKMEEIIQEIYAS